MTPSQFGAPNTVCRVSRYTVPAAPNAMLDCGAKARAANINIAITILVTRNLNVALLFQLLVLVLVVRWKAK